MNWKREAQEQGLVLLVALAISFAALFAGFSLAAFFAGSPL